MANELGSLTGSERITPDDDETLIEFYTRYRGDEIKEATKKSFRNSYNAIESFVCGDFESDGKEITNTQITKKILELDKDCVEKWCNWMVSDFGIKPNTADKYLNKITKMISDLKRDNYIGGTGSPFKDVRNLNPFDYENGSIWPEIDYDEFVVAILNVSHPRDLAILITLCKTGIRVSALVNLDERDINIDHAVSATLDEPRREIMDKSNTIYIDSSINKGEMYNGEKRSMSNKEKSHRIIPIDDELAETLGWYISCRPQSSHSSKPVFTQIQKQNKRIGVQIVRDTVNRLENNFSLGSKLSISPHYFRHWYTTQVRNNLTLLDRNKYPGTPAQIVKGLRGDSDDDTIDTYSHEWHSGLEKDIPPTEAVIRDNIPKFFN